jgi:hypothetical protein
MGHPPALDRGIARRGSCCGGDSVTHTEIFYRPDPTHDDETVMNGTTDFSVMLRL